MVYKATEWKSQSGVYHIQCDNLVGTGRNWNEPAKILGITNAEFVKKLVNTYGATIKPYRNVDGKLMWIGYSWKNLAKAREFKNLINKIAREKNYQI